MHFHLKFKINSTKIPVKTNRTSMQTTSFVNIIFPHTSILSYSNTYTLYKHSHKKPLRVIIVVFMKNSPNKYYHVQISSIFFKGKSSSELKLIFIYFSSLLSRLLVFDLIRSLIFLHSPSNFFNVFLLNSRNQHQIFLSITFFSVPIYFINKIQRIYTINFYTITQFTLLGLNIYKNIFV